MYLVASSAELAAVVSTALNPLSPWPGMAWPLRGSWFLFSFLSAVAFGILSNTKALPFTADVAFATSSFVAASFATTAFALANSAFADSIAEAVFLVDAAFSKAASKRAIAASNLLVSTFGVSVGASAAFGVSAGAASGAGVAGAGAAGCSAVCASTVGVAVYVEAWGLLESAWFPASGFTCSFVTVVVEGASAWTVAAPPNIM